MVFGKNWFWVSLVLVFMILDLLVVMVLLYYCYISL